jgi:outer membrane protein
MKIDSRQFLRIAVVAALAASVAAPAALAADVVDIGYLDQGEIAAIPAFASANREINTFGNNLQRDYTARARNAPAAEQQRLAAEFQGKMADEQRKVLGPLFGRAQVAIANVASSKNLSVVVDKRIVVYGGVDVTPQVRDILTGPGQPVPPVTTPPPSTVGYVDQQQLDALPKIKNATDEFGKFKAAQDQATAAKLKSAKTQADRDAILKDYQKTLTDRQNQSLKPLADQTRTAMADVAKKRGLTLVVDRANIIYGGTDITSDVTAAVK